ncbi:protein kinase [Angomonas deanei]|nr:protein kinase [Angomonas deanei]|eukprot:EPY42602.1 protein kinase [Angomonas deanei]
MKRMRRFLHSSSRGKNVGLHSTTHREIQLLTTLRHPNITHIVDSFILEDGTVIVFFPIVAHDLSALQRTKRDAFGVRQSGLLPLPVVKCIFRQLLEAVAHIHAHKVIHRDIKPSNIMVDHNGIVSLIDFGWARYQRIKGQMTGNPCNIVYRAPEMIANPYFASHYDFSVDVWCCGCVLFELLTGSRFITASNEMDTLRCIQDWLGAPPAKSAIYRSKSVLFGFDNKRQISLVNGAICID